MNICEVIVVASVTVILFLLVTEFSDQFSEKLTGCLKRMGGRSQDKDEFEVLQARLETGTPVVVMFYASWCGACKALKPTYDEATKRMEEQGFTLLKVDHDEHRLAIDEAYPEVGEGIEFYPTIMALRLSSTGEVVSAVYEGDRTVDALSEFAREYA